MLQIERGWHDLVIILVVDQEVGHITIVVGNLRVIVNLADEALEPTNCIPMVIDMLAKYFLFIQMGWRWAGVIEVGSGAASCRMLPLPAEPASSLWGRKRCGG